MPKISELKMGLKYFLCSFYLISVWGVLTCAESLDVPNTCEELGDCPSNAIDCEEICGCNETMPTVYDNTTQTCVINYAKLIDSLTEKYNTEAKIREEADRVFQGVIIAALLFISCASICVISACVYCCRMNYTDYRLKKSIKILGKKMGANPQLKRPNVQPTKPISESCNVVVEEAGVFCV